MPANDSSGIILFHLNKGIQNMKLSKTTVFEVYNDDLINGSFTIPPEITLIAARAFFECDQLQTITIPDGVTVIERDAFWGCTQLQTITLPEAITSIGDSAFGNCPELHSLIITSNDEAAIQRITKLLPVDLQNKVVPMELAEEALQIRNAQLARLSQTPETNSLFRFFHPGSQATSTSMKLPIDIFKAMNPFMANPYFLEAEKLILALPLPTNKEQISSYKNSVETIINQCITEAKTAAYTAHTENENNNNRPH